MPNSRPAATEVVQALQEIEKYGTSNTLPIRIVADRPKASREEEEFRVAVLPFKYRGSNSDIEALAEGPFGRHPHRVIALLLSAGASRVVPPSFYKRER